MLIFKNSRTSFSNAGSSTSTLVSPSRTSKGNGGEGKVGMQQHTRSSSSVTQTLELAVVSRLATPVTVSLFEPHTKRRALRDDLEKAAPSSSASNATATCVCQAASGSASSSTSSLRVGKDKVNNKKLRLSLLPNEDTSAAAATATPWTCTLSTKTRDGQWTRVKLSREGSARPDFYALLTTSCTTLHLLLLPTRPLPSWQSLLPSSLPLSSLCIPGTHETLARYGWPITKCQSLSSTTGAQVRAGIRWMDIRVTPKGPAGKERLLAYHGSTSQRIELGAALQPIYDWLGSEEGKGESLIFSIKPEGGAKSEDVERLLYSVYITGETGNRFWWLEDRIPTLGEAKGKLVLFSRFGGSQDRPGGIHPSIWPDNFKGHWAYDLPETSKGPKQGVVTQDWYHIGSFLEIPTKFGLATELLSLDSPVLPSNPDGTPRHDGDAPTPPSRGVGPASDPNTLVINFLSASTVPWALPPLIAKGLFWRRKWWPRALSIQGMNDKMAGWVADRLVEAAAAGTAEGEGMGALDHLQATFPIDFYDDDTLPNGEGGGDGGEAGLLVSLLIEANFVRAQAAAASRSS